jgi:hypothetical protein
MVKVIGKAPMKKFQVACKTCHSLLEYTIEDQGSKFIRDIDGGGDAYYYVVCPRCETQVNIDKIDPNNAYEKT